ncbi:SCO family protein [Paracoccus simplex]|uniref:SCO family protein n=1 Tax=Paracoccus simplex TaxID=2086346 RepID=A0ABV7S2K7_9RHOB
MGTRVLRVRAGFGIDTHGGMRDQCAQGKRRAMMGEDGRMLILGGLGTGPGVCRTDNARNAGAVSILDENGMQVTPVFITVAPRRDTPEPPRMIGLTGSRPEIDAVSKTWGHYCRLNDRQDAKTHPADHLTNTSLVLAAAGPAEIVDRDHSARQIADRSACFIDVASNARI